MRSEQGTEHNESATPDAEEGPESPASSEGKLEDAVRRSMRDLEQEIRGRRGGGHRPRAS